MINMLGCPCIVQPMIILIHKILDVVKIAVPIGLVIFGLIDFGKATIAGDENAIKKSQSLFIKRLISGVAVFLVFMIVDFVVTLLASKGVDTGDNGWLSCWNAEPGDKCEELLGESGGSSKTCGAGCPIGYSCYQGGCKTDDEIKSIEDSQKSSQDKCNESPGNWSVGSQYCICIENAERSPLDNSICSCKSGYTYNNKDGIKACSPGYNPIPKYTER